MDSYIATRLALYTVASARDTRGRSPSRAGRRIGYTLLELLMVVLILGVLVAMAAANYRRVVERTYFREAQTLLLAIYHGERGYVVVNNSYLHNPTTSAQWREINVDDPNSLTSLPVQFSVDALTCSPAPCFVATAERQGGTCDTKTLTIDQNRTSTPDLSTTVCWTGCGCD